MKDTGIYENSIVIITSDHGGVNKGHGGKTMSEMETPFIISSNNIRSGSSFVESMMQFNLARIFDLDTPQMWIGRSMDQVFNQELSENKRLV
jgi:predicted AlkP superfamily pyrophosphatase or phosphodiesterase